MELLSLPNLRLRKGRRIIMKDILGYYYTDRLICIGCAFNEQTLGEEATADAIPNGFTCADCGITVNV